MTRARAVAAVAALAVVAVAALLVGRGDDDGSTPTGSAGTTDGTPADGGDDAPTEGPGPTLDDPPATDGTDTDGTGTDGTGTDGDGTDGDGDPTDPGPGPGWQDVVPGPAADPVPLEATTDAEDGVEVRLSAIEPVQVEGSLPGERSGPGVAVTVELANRSDRAVDIGQVTVDLVDAQRRSATPVVDPDRPPLRGSLAPGETATGTYLFAIPVDQRAEVAVVVIYASTAPAVIFTGALPG